ncbi:SH3 domain-containing protein [Roseomonas sp. E05]|uniref:SH3 domain-containing protein n=1 Tax=Roseomonas sp. E05 TaxID=3046310 RepID=UPI0024B9B270|nr:SH3 domain-containing protein [Roseomonas sp. E05]MDJ0390093.1 SH3 domain-containing protein [Roseomonas sp. E05]
MSTAANTGPSGFPEIEFRLVGGRLRAFGQGVAPASAQERPVGTPAGVELDLSHVGFGLKSISDEVRQLEAELPRILTARDAAFRRTARAAKPPLLPFMERRLPALRTKLAAAEGRLGDAVARRNACWTALQFSFSQTTLVAFRNVAAAFGALEAVRFIWVTTSWSCGTYSAPMSGAALQRRAIRIGPTLPEHVESDWPGLAFRHSDGVGLEIYPGFAMTGAGVEAKVVSLLDVHLDAAEAIVAEVIDPPADAVMVNRIWEKANKDGSPDRRYASNRSIPILRYGLLRFAAPGMTAVSYLVSNPDLARRFATAFSEFQRCMAAEAASQASASLSSGTTRTAPAERRMASVPPPPVVGQAHEYTVATLAACAISAWLLVAGPIGDRQAVASNTVPPPVQTETASQRPRAPVVHPETAAASPPTPEHRKDPAPTTPSTPPPQAATSPDRERIVIRSGGANIRSGPNGTAEVLRTTSGGTHLNVFGRSNGWVRVGDAEAWGWVHSSLLEGGN